MVLQVLREEMGWSSTPYQWATVGYAGAVGSGKTICGFLFGGTVFLGYLYGDGSADAPALDDDKRWQSITAVRELYQGFIERFGDTDCQTLIGLDLAKQEDVDRYFKEESYGNTCRQFFEYVIAECRTRKEQQG